MNRVNDAAATTQPPAIRAARMTVDALIARGMRDAVVCPGSRSAPLAYALADAEAAGRIRLHVRIDERTAGFLALGLARGAALAGISAPVAVVTTSGTAVANLHPALLEAHHAGVPVVALTADRPHELRGTGANQTTDQVGIFGPAVRYAVDMPAPAGRDGEDQDVRDVVARAVTAALGTRNLHPGPVHLNLAYRDPLVPLGEPALARPALVEPVESPLVLSGITTLPDDSTTDSRLAVGPDEPLTVLVAGDGAGLSARTLAEARGWPILAEASSGAAGGPNVIAAHRLVLGVEALVGSVRRVVVAGRPTLSRPVHGLLGRADVEVVVLAPGGAPWPDAARSADVILPAVPNRWLGGTPGPSAHLDRWRQASVQAAGAIEASLDEGPLTGVHVARAVAHAAGPDGLVVIGSSNPVRDLDLVLGVQPPTVMANRGLAGIDGTISTAIGVATSAGRPAMALVGDLTFLHDAGGLLRGPHEPPVDLRIVVVNDDGGSIFATLEHGRIADRSEADAARFERVFGTPHGADIETLCAGYGIPTVSIDATSSVAQGPRAALAEALGRPMGGIEVVHIRVSRSDRGVHSRALAVAVDAACTSARS